MTSLSKESAQTLSPCHSDLCDLECALLGFDSDRREATAPVAQLLLNRFGIPRYEEPSAVTPGSVVIREGSPSDRLKVIGEYLLDPSNHAEIAALPGEVPTLDELESFMESERLTRAGICQPSRE